MFREIRLCSKSDNAKSRHDGVGFGVLGYVCVCVGVCVCVSVSVSESMSVSLFVCCLLVCLHVSACM